MVFFFSSQREEHSTCTFSHTVQSWESQLKLSLWQFQLRFPARKEIVPYQLTQNKGKYYVKKNYASKIRLANHRQPCKRCGLSRRPQWAIFVHSEPPTLAILANQYRFCSSAATLARFFHLGTFCPVRESNTKFTRCIACCAGLEENVNPPTV